MPMTIYKLHASTAGDSVASLDIQLDGEIESIHMAMFAADCDALNDAALAEMSFLSTNSFTSNDVRGSLMIVQSGIGFLTQGGGNMAQNANISSLQIPVAAGERIHLHISLIGGCSSAATHGYMYVRDKGTPRIPGRRR